MALSTLVNRTDATATAGATVFPIGFTYFDEDEINVYLNGVLKSVGSDYTLENPGSNNLPQDVEFVAPLALNDKVVIVRIQDLETTLDLTTGSAREVAIGKQIDKLCAMVQQIDEITDRCTKTNITTPGTNYELPVAEANKILGWNSAGTALENKTIDLTALEADVAALEVDVGILEGQMVDVISDVGNLESGISLTDSRVGALETTAGIHNTLINTANANISTLQGDVAALTDQEANILTLQADMIDAEADIIAMQLDINDLDTAINDGVNGVIKRVETLEYQVGLNVGRIAGSQELLNNNAAATRITKLKYDSDGLRSARIQVEIERKTDDKHIFTTGMLALHYIGSQWYVKREYTTEMLDTLADDGTEDGIIFNIDMDGVDVGYITYTSDNMAGANYVGKIKFLSQEISIGF
jgi:hypothetical protein